MTSASPHAKRQRSRSHPLEFNVYSKPTAPQANYVKHLHKYNDSDVLTA